MSNQVISFPKLIDSKVTTQMIIENKEIIPTAEIEFLIEEDKAEKTLLVSIDHGDLYNINYEIKSALNQINEHIKIFNH